MASHSYLPLSKRSRLSFVAEIEIENIGKSRGGEKHESVRNNRGLQWL
jgi:hypothetical protein